MTFNLNYTYGSGIDNAPLPSTLAVQGDDGRSDPANLERDRGPNALDTRHSFNGSIVAMSSWHQGPELMRTLLSNNQAALILQFNSGIPFTVRGNLDLNGDGATGDRPLNVTRNSVYLPARYNVDARLSRFVKVGGSRRADCLRHLRDVAHLDPGRRQLFPATGGYEQRKFELGFKFYF